MNLLIKARVDGIPHKVSPEITFHCIKEGKTNEKGLTDFAEKVYELNEFSSKIVAVIPDYWT